MYRSIYFSLTFSYNDKKYFKLHKIHSDLVLKNEFHSLIIVFSTVNNVIIHREEMFAGATDRHVCGLTISWQNRLILCLGFHHFMTKHTDTISGDWPFHEKTDWYYVWGLTISWQKKLILCLGIDHFMTKHTDTMSGVSPFHDITHWYYVWGSTISWENRMILYLGIDYFMT